MKKSLQIFQDKKIRSQWNEDESQWYFSVVDIVEALTESPNPRQYWRKIKDRVDEFQLYPIWVQLKLESSDGKKYATDCANTKGIFRIIQSIPSPKAEPFKLWLAQVGHERIQEIEDPELTQERMKKMYEQKGYSKNWIDKRLQGMAIRQNLTDEWKERGIENQKDYAILTAEISKATFGMTPSEYKNHKNLPEKSKANLRDNMTDLELIFTMLGEKVTTDSRRLHSFISQNIGNKISESEKPESFEDNKNVANRGGKVAGNARKETEKELGRTTISPENFLDNPENQEKLI